MLGRQSKYYMPTSPMDKIHAKAFYESTNHHVKSLSPAGKRLLVKLVRAFNTNKGKAITRRDVAILLARQNITPHDCNLLQTLCDKGLLQSNRVPVWTNDGRPAGAQWQYSMSQNTGWALNKMLSRKRKKS